MNQENPEKKHKALFITLIQQFQMQGWVSLGRIKNPTSDQIERNLNMAVYTIDTLAMLKEKTRGNLDEDESRFLEQTLTDLRLSLDSDKENINQTSPKGKENKPE
jgi:hypothetical protein